MNETELLVELVDERDNPIGTMNKLEAHRHPTLHRAISVLVFTSSGDWLLHRRAASKYHSPASEPMPAAPIPSRVRRTPMLPDVA